MNWLNDICRIWANETRSTFKDEGVMIFFVLVPLLYPLLYSWIYTNEVVREVPIAIVDMSHSQMSREFIRRMDASPDTRVALYCNNLNEAKAAVGRQEVFGVLYFPSDFQNRVGRTEQSHVSLFCDMSFMLYYKAVFQTATAVAGEMNTRIQTQRAGNWTNREDEIAAKPLDFDEVQMFNPTGGYGNFIIPGVLMLIVQQTLLLGIGMMAGTARERTGGVTPNPICTNGNGTLTTVLGRALCYLMIYAVITAYVALAVPRMFGFTSLLHAADSLLFLLPYLLSCIFFSMAASCFVRRREDVILLVVFTSVPLLFISGVSWPQSAIPELWQWLSSVFPSTFGIRGFVRMNTMGAQLSDIRTEYIALWAQTAFYFVATCLIYHRRLKG